MDLQRCFIHPDRPATIAKNVPCAPGGKLWVCPECARPENCESVFLAYKNQHGGAARIDNFTKSYRGSRSKDGTTTVFVSTRASTKPLPVEPSLKIRNHSPDGFNWGYGGSGPAQLALAILLDYSGSKELADRYYQEFKRDFVCLFGDNWDLPGDQIKAWLSRKGFAVPGENDITFLQYLRPDGRQQEIWIERPPEIVELARKIAAAGYRFEVEELTTGEASFEIVRDIDDPDVGDSIALELVPNGPGVPEAVDRLVRTAAEKLNLRQVL